MIDYLEAGDLDAERRRRLGPLDDEFGYDLADLNGNIRAIQRRQIGYMRARAGIERQLNQGVESGRLDPNYAYNHAQRQQANNYQPHLDTPYERYGTTGRRELPKMDDFWRSAFEGQAVGRRVNAAYQGARNNQALEDMLAQGGAIDFDSARRDAQRETDDLMEDGRRYEAAEPVRRAAREATSLYAAKPPQRMGRAHYLADPNAFDPWPDEAQYTGVAGTPRYR
jgi:hypothetical protein